MSAIRSNGTRISTTLTFSRILQELNMIKLISTKKN